MANVIHPSIDFHPHPVNHSPSPFGFGFGLSTAAASTMVAGWPSSAMTPGHKQPSAFQQLASSMNQNSPRVQKRRHEPEEESEKDRLASGIRDDAMDRSPTPERPRRAAPKRARITPLVDSGSRDKVKDNKSSEGNDGNDVDVGMLLASLPTQSLLPLLTSLLNTQPSLKTTILPLIPRPTLETATQALSQSAKKLRDAYPYSNTLSPSFSHPTTPSFGFGSGSGFGSHRSGSFGGSTQGFVRSASQQTTFGQSNVPNANHNGMRDSYILSRLRPHITEFVSACLSYLPYFSYIRSSLGDSSFSQPHSHSIALQALHKDKSHPSETYLFLAALTHHFFSQPLLTQSSLAPLLLPRVSEEWKAWVDRVDEVVNREGGMFGSETVRSWEKGLDEFVNAKGSEGAHAMRDIRDRWVSKVGWLVGRSIQLSMEEEE